MKHIIRRIFAVTLALTFLLLSAGCASAPGGSVKNCFVFGENGYEFKAAPYGSPPEKLANAIDNELALVGSSSTPFEYDNYITASYVELLGLNGKVDAQFTTDGLFAFTYSSAVAPDSKDEVYAGIHDQFVKDFGEPTVTEDLGSGSVTSTWEDKEGGTALILQVSASDKKALIQVGVFEKWRYIEKGVGEWAEE